MTDWNNRLQRWQGKVALITGASSGIGEAVAHSLGALGMKVALMARRKDRLEDLAEQIIKAGGEALVLPTDLGNVDYIYQSLKGLKQQWQGMDVLINNAGMGRRESFVEVDWEYLQSQIDINIRAAAILMREAYQDMKNKPEGAIINISSMAGHRLVNGRGGAFYSGTKHHLRVMTEGMRAELVENQSTIKIGCISPGMVDTEFHQAASTDGVPIGANYTMLAPQDIADAALYMLSTPPHVQIGDIALRPIAQPH